MGSKRLGLDEDEINEIVRLYSEEKLSIAEISRRFDVSTTSLREVLVRMGVHKPRKTTSKRATCFAFLDAHEDCRTSDALIKALGLSRAYACFLLNDWKSIHGKLEPTRYLTNTDLKDLQSVIRIGDKIRLRKELFAKEGVVVTINGKYPNFAITDKGAKQWFDIFDAVWNVPENKEVLERCQKLQTA